MLSMLVTGLLYVPVMAQQPPATAAPVVPSDLRPLLLPRQSEMRLVTQRYTADRGTLSNYFSAGGGRGGGRGAGPVETVQLSAARIARLERFDLDWQAALATLDPA